MNKGLSFSNLKNIVIIGILFMATVLPLALFGLSILLGLLFQIITIAFN